MSKICMICNNMPLNPVCWICKTIIKNMFNMANYMYNVQIRPICKICKAVCRICIICDNNFNMQNMHPLCWCTNRWAAVALLYTATVVQTVTVIDFGARLPTVGDDLWRFPRQNPNRDWWPGPLGSISNSSQACLAQTRSVACTLGPAAGLFCHLSARPMMEVQSLQQKPVLYPSKEKYLMIKPWSGPINASDGKNHDQIQWMMVRTMIRSNE